MGSESDEIASATVLIRRGWNAIKNSGFPLIAMVYLVLIGFSIETMELGSVNTVFSLSHYWWGGLASILVFDSWGTAVGLVGILAPYAIVILGVQATDRRAVSMFLLLSSLVSAILADVLWDGFVDNEIFDGVKLVASGESTIPLAGEGAVVVFSIVGLLAVSRLDRRRLNRLKTYGLFWLKVLYVMMIAEAILYVVFLQPIFTPVQGYNWQAHEFSFLIGIALTSAFVVVMHRWNRLGSLFGQIRGPSTDPQHVGSALPYGRSHCS